MSFGNFLKKIWGGIKSVFNDLPDDLKNAVHIGVIVTENVKNFVDSPGADVLTAIIPGEVGDVIKARLRANLPKILTELKLADKCGQLTDTSEIVKCAVQTLQQIQGDFKSAFLHDLSILIAQVASDGKLDWKDGTYILQWYYTHKFKNEDNDDDAENATSATSTAAVASNN
jgi:hypothetical protein